MKKFKKLVRWEISIEIWPKKVQLRWNLIKNKSKSFLGKLLISFTSAPRSRPKLNLWNLRLTFICMKNWKIFTNQNSTKTFNQKKKKNKINNKSQKKLKLHNYKPFSIQHMLLHKLNSKNKIKELFLRINVEHVFWIES